MNCVQKKQIFFLENSFKTFHRKGVFQPVVYYSCNSIWPQILCSVSNISILLIRWTDRWLWRRKAFRHVIVKCPARTGKGKGLVPQRRICIFQRILCLISISTCILKVQVLWASTATLPIHCRPPLPSTATPACPTHTTHQLPSYPAWCDRNHGKLGKVVQNTHNCPAMC